MGSLSERGRGRGMEGKGRGTLHNTNGGGWEAQGKRGGKRGGVGIIASAYIALRAFVSAGCAKVSVKTNKYL